MFIDASALTAIITDEVDAFDLAAPMHASRARLTSPLAIWETTLAVARILRLPLSEGAVAVERFLATADIRVVAIDPGVRHAAIEAYDRYGKSRHPAALNFGDCFAYACAKSRDVPLLYKGNDFSQTDLA